MPAPATGLPRFRLYTAQASVMASHSPPAPSIAPASILAASPHPYPAQTSPGKAMAMASKVGITVGMALPHFLRVRVHLPGTAGSVTFC